MSEQEIRSIGERFIREVWSVDGDVEVADELLTPFLASRRAGPGTREGEKQWAMAFRSALGIRSEVQDVLVDSDRAAIHWKTTGTHKGEIFGVPATGKSFTIHGVSLIRVRDGKVVENRTIADQMGLMQQLGVAPSPGGRG